MKKLFSKLNNRRGASILMALLLFLICALAGAAALTAAGSNIGRYSYLEEDQQQYLAVSSAAKLIRDQFNHFTIMGEYNVAAEDNDEQIKWDPTERRIKIVRSTPKDPEKFERKFKLKNKEEEKEVESGKHISDLFAEYLESIVNDSFFDYFCEIKDESSLWGVSGIEENKSKYIIAKTSDEYSYTLSCDGMDDVNIDITIDISNKHRSVNSTIATWELGDIIIRVSHEDTENTAYEIEGTINAEARLEDDTKTALVIRDYVNTYGDPPVSETITVPEQMILGSKIIVTVSIDLSDEDIVRVIDTEEEAPGP